MSDCTHPDECERTHQALKLAYQTALTLGGRAAQPRIAKFGVEAILERLNELRTLPHMPNGSPHPRVMQIMRMSIGRCTGWTPSWTRPTAKPIR